MASIFQKFRDTYSNFVNYKAPQSLAQIASNPQLNRVAQGFNRIPSQTTSLIGPIGTLINPQKRQQFGQAGQQVRTAGIRVADYGSQLGSKGNILQQFVGQQFSRPLQYAGYGLQDIGLLSQVAAKPKIFTQAPAFTKESFMDPNRLSKASIGLSLLSLKPTSAFRAGAGVSKFKMNKLDYDGLIRAEEMFINPKKFLKEANLGKHATKGGFELARKNAIETIKRRGKDMIEATGIQYLSKDELFKLKTPQAMVKKLVDYHQQNKLGYSGKMFVEEGKGTQITKGVEVKPTQLDRIKMAQEEALQPRIEPKAQVKGVVPKGVRVVSGVGEVTPKMPGGIQGPSAKSLTQDKYSFNVNMNRLDLTKPEKQTLRTSIESVKPELAKLKGKTLSNDEVLKAAKSSDMLTQVTTRDQTLAAEAAMLKARQGMVSLNKQIDQLARSGDTPQLQTKMRELINSLRVVSSNAADTGRKLQALSIEAGDESIRSSILKDVARIETDTEKILREAAGVDWNNANSIAKFYRKFIKPTTTEILDEFRYNNMLSNPRTHIRNAFSNLIQTFLTRPATLLAQGKVGETAQYYKGSLKSLPDAFSAFSDAFRGKTAVAKPDIAHIPTFRLPRFLTVPTRAMEAADRFFSTLIKGGEIARGAGAEEALQTAEYSLFRQGLRPKGQGKILNVIDSATEGVYQMGKKIPIMRWFVPFVRTPMNFAKQWIEYSPTGALTMIGATNKKEQLAKSIIGSIVTLAGAKLAFDGNTTWAAPTDPKEKELFYASGRKPYSFRVGDQWISMQYAGPFAFAIALPSAVKYYNDESRTALTDSQLDKLQKISFSMAEYLSGQTFMEGLGNFVSMFKGDTDFSLGKNLGYTAGQFIPLQGLVRWASTLVDPVYRKTKTAGEQIISNIPFASKSLEPYTTPTGEESTRQRINLLTPYDVIPQVSKYEPQLKARGARLQENAVLNKKIKEFDSLEQRAKALFESGNTEAASKIIQENKEVFQKGMLIKSAQKDVKKWQEMRDRATEETTLSPEQRAIILKRIEEELLRRIEVLNNL